MNKFSYSSLEESFNKITLRERLIMFGALAFCSFVICYFWIIEPAQVQQGKINKSLRNSVQQEQLVKNEIITTTKRLQEDPLKEINNDIAFSKATLKQLNNQLDNKLVKFIHAQNMPIALTKVLSKTPGVKITGLKSLPVKVFNTDSKAVNGATQSPFYKHTLQITLQGNYNGIYQYLLNVETLQDKFYWHSLVYQVSDYPLAEVTLEIYTLSDQRDLVSG